MTYLTADLEPKRLGLLHELVRRATAIAVLVNPANANAENQSKELEQACDHRPHARGSGPGRGRQCLCL